MTRDPELPDPQLFVRRFGPLVRAYDTVGLPRSLTYALERVRRGGGPAIGSSA